GWVTNPSTMRSRTNIAPFVSLRSSIRSSTSRRVVRHSSVCKVASSSAKLSCGFRIDDGYGAVQRRRGAPHSGRIYFRQAADLSAVRGGHDTPRDRRGVVRAGLCEAAGLVDLREMPEECHLRCPPRDQDLT